MKVEQIYPILNTVIKETLGESAIVAEDLSNIVDIGRQVFDSEAVDKYVKKLINHIGRVKFVNRTYNGSAPKVLMEDWEFGSVLEKIDMDIPTSVQNEDWELVDGQTYNQDIFHSPKVYAKFFNNAVTFETDMSFAASRVEQSFSNAVQLNAFFSMIENRIQMRKTMDYDNLIRRTINNFTAATLHDLDNAGTFTGKTGVRAINLLYKYNQATGETLTPEKCLRDLNFLKFAAYTIALTSDRMRSVTSLFNMGKRPRFTPSDLQHLILLSEFGRAADVYLQSDTFHNEFTALPNSEHVPYWQGTGTDYEFSSTSDIHVNIKDPNSPETTVEVVASGILGVLFDHEALGVNNRDDKVESHYNAKAGFVNNFYKSFARYFNDYNENFVVFYVA